MDRVHVNTSGHPTIYSYFNCMCCIDMWTYIYVFSSVFYVMLLIFSKDVGIHDRS